MTVQYCQPWLRPQESQLLIAPPDVARRLPPRVRAMLGYSIHPPFIGQVEGKHPLRLVDDEAYRARELPTPRSPTASSLGPTPSPGDLGVAMPE